MTDKKEAMDEIRKIANDLAFIAKHLPGRHNQADHSRGRSRGGAIRIGGPEYKKLGSAEKTKLLRSAVQELAAKTSYVRVSSKTYAKMTSKQKEMNKQIGMLEGIARNKLRTAGLRNDVNARRELHVARWTLEKAKQIKSSMKKGKSYGFSG